MVPLDVLAPKGMLDNPLILASDVQKGQLGLAAEGVAGKDVGEDGGTIDQMMLPGAVTTSTQGGTAAQTGFSSLRY